MMASRSRSSPAENWFESMLTSFSQRSFNCVSLDIAVRISAKISVGFQCCESIILALSFLYGFPRYCFGDFTGLRTDSRDLERVFYRAGFDAVIAGWNFCRDKVLNRDAELSVAPCFLEPAKREDCRFCADIYRSCDWNYAAGKILHYHCQFLRTWAVQQVVGWNLRRFKDDADYQYSAEPFRAIKLG